MQNREFTLNKALLSLVLYGMNRPAFTSVLFLFLLAGGGSAARAALPAVELIPALPKISFDRPLAVVASPDSSNRLFVVEQAGRILVVPNSPDAEKPGVFLDITNKVRTVNNEEGLLSLSFHPGYASNGYFFVYYAASDPQRTVLSRFRVSRTDPNQADLQSERVLLQVGQPYGNHKGGTLLFGPDGLLYLSLGDGGSAGDPHGNGQNLGTLLAKIIRIDVDHSDSGLAYAIPPGNPFRAKPGARPEIWAYGLRNVWRMSFDRQTGDLWAADVGQDAWEEINLITKGGDYGWNIREGAHPYEPTPIHDSLIEPIIDYPHPTGASVTGGYVYRGAKYPSLKGVYIYGDYVTGTIWGLRYEHGRVTDQGTLLQQPRNISSFGEDGHGEILLTCFDGHVYRLAAK
jgi:glucose/arabinose dehydrogenase